VGREGCSWRVGRQLCQSKGLRKRAGGVLVRRIAPSGLFCRKGWDDPMPPGLWRRWPALDLTHGGRLGDRRAGIQALRWVGALPRFADRSKKEIVIDQAPATGRLMSPWLLVE
jgi:hypothetical protein